MHLDTRDAYTSTYCWWRLAEPKQGPTSNLHVSLQQLAEFLAEQLIAFIFVQMLFLDQPDVLEE